MIATTQDTQRTSPAIPIGIDQLEFRLQGQLSGRVRNLKLVRKDKGIVLTGVARTYYAKQMAQHAVMEQTTIPILCNDIVVD